MRRQKILKRVVLKIVNNNQMKMIFKTHSQIIIGIINLNMEDENSVQMNKKLK